MQGLYTEKEQQIAQVWGETLGFHQVDVNDNFYELGGDSILALKIVNQISQQGALELEVADLFKHATIASLAEFVLSSSQQFNRRADFYASLHLRQKAIIIR